MSWTNTCPNAEFLEITFDARTSLEGNFDFLSVMDAGGTHVPGSPFTGTQLAGQTLVIPGNTVVLRLETDSLITDWGFAVSNLSVLGPSSMPVLEVGQYFHVVWEVQNQGSDPVRAPFFDEFFASTNRYWTNGVWLGEEMHTEALAPGARYTRSATLPLRDGLPGDQFLILQTVMGEEESNKGNNELMQAFRIKSPDFAVVSLSAPGNAMPHELITVTWTVTNLSPFTVSGPWYDEIAIINDKATNRAWFWHGDPLAADGFYTVTQQVKLYDTTAGSNLLQIAANISGPPETNRDNNFASVPIFITTPDLVAIRAAAPLTATPRYGFYATLAVSNAGPVTAYPEWHDVAYLSPTNRLTPEAIYVGEVYNYSAPIAPSMVYTQQLYLTINETFSRDCYLLFVADGYSELADPAFDNNIVALPLRIEAADLVPTSFNGSRLIVAPNETITLDWRVENRGTMSTPSGWRDVVELANEPTGSNSFIRVASSWIDNQSVAPGGNYSQSVSGSIPPWPPGDYYLVLKVDGERYVGEANEKNNTLSLPITITGADLVAESISAPAVVAVQEPFTVTWTVRNLGPSTAYPPWNDSFFIAPVTNPAPFENYLGYFSASTALAAGSAYTMTQTVTAGGLPAGDYSLSLLTDYDPFTNTNANDRTSTPIRIVGVDLAAVALSAPSTISLGSNFTVSLLISNAGPVTAYGPWYHYFYISPTNHLDADPVQIGWVEVRTQLVASATAVITADLYLQDYRIQTGNQYLAGGIYPESLSDPNPSNNFIWAPIRIQAPDLVPESFTALLPFTNCAPPFPESPHPVAAIDRIWTNTCPGAEALKVSFDRQTDAASGWIDVTDGDGNPVSGSPFYWTYLANATVTVPGDTVRIRFVRTQSWTAWGFAVTQIVGCTGVTTFTAAPQQSIDLQWRIRNIGGASTISGWHDAVALKVSRYSSDQQWLVGVYHANPLGPGKSESVSQSVWLPSLKPGRHELVVRADDGDEILEGSETNNSRSLTLDIASPDLVAVDFQGPSAVDGQSTFQVVWRVGNAGPVVAFPSWYDQVYISPTNRMTSEAIELPSYLGHYTQLIPGEYYSATQSLSLPAVPAGNYYLILKVDKDNVLFDPNPENNQFAIPIAIQSPDLAPVHFSALTNGPACPGPYPSRATPFPLNAELWWTNSCPGATALKVQFTAPSVYSGGDQVTLFDAAGHEIPTYPYYVDRVVNVPGDKVIFRLRTDNEPNNDYPFSVSSIVPLLPRALSTLSPHETVDVLYVVENLGPGTAWNNWTDAILFSPDSVLDPQDPMIAQFGAANPLGYGPWLQPGARYVGTGQLTMPTHSPGDSFLLLKTDGYNYISETSESNNVAALPIHFETADLRVATIFATNRGSARQTIKLTWSVRNDGPGTAWPSWLDSVYLSAKPDWDQTAIQIANIGRSVRVRSGQTYIVNSDVTLPRIAGGDYYLIVRADSDNSLGDSNLTNNFRSTPITILAPDLVPRSLTALRTLNSCPGPYPQAPPPFGSTNTVRWNYLCPGASNLFVTFDPNAYVQQYLAILDRNRNPISGSPFSGYIGGQRFFVPGDAVVLELTGPSFSDWHVSDISSVVETTNIVAAPQSRLDLKWTAQNIGSGFAMPSFFDAVTFSTDLVTDRQDLFSASSYLTQPIAPGAPYIQQTSGTLGGIPAGTYYLRLRTDFYDDLIESNETNNYIFAPITITPPADLMPIAFRVPPSVTTTHPRPTIEVSWAVTNQGVAATPEFWYDTIYISTDPILDGSDSVLANFVHQGSLAPGQFYTATQSVTLYTPAAGRYYLFLSVDSQSYQSVYEANETNNQLVAIIDVNLVLPDLVITSATAPTRVFSGHDQVTVQVEWVVRNKGAGTVEGSWSDFFTVNGLQGTTAYYNGPLPPGGSYTNRASIYLNQPTNGLYVLTVTADSPYDQILESNETNNSRTVSFEFVHSPPEVVSAGDSGTVPVSFASTSAVALITFDLIVPGQKLYGLSAYSSAPNYWNAYLFYPGGTNGGQNPYSGRIEAYGGDYISNTQEVARIVFQAGPNQPSGFAPLWISNLVARTKDGVIVPNLVPRPEDGGLIPNVILRASRAVIIGAQPLVDAAPLGGGQYSLTLYGYPGSNVVLESRESLSGPGWETVWQGTFTNNFQSLGPVPATGRSRFYRARY